MADGNRSGEAFDLTAIATALKVSKRAIEMRATRESWPFDARTGRGGAKRFYALSRLPTEVQTAVLLAHRPAPLPAPAPPRSDEAVRTAWARFEAVPQHIKDIANERLAAVQTVERLVVNGTPLCTAREIVAAELKRKGVRGGSVASVTRWMATASTVDKQHRLAALLPEWTGRTATVEIPAEAWDLFKADYLRVEAPTASSCYERLQRIAKARGWTLPSKRTFERRLDEIPRGVRVLTREGEEALMRTFPAQERDRSAFHALEAVNADGHVFDVFVRTPMGHTVRPIMVGVQDLYSGKLLGWRIAETESADLARLAFHDVVRDHGIPGKAWLDNGRGFASKMLTGGVANRFRFKVREEDPTGVLVGMGTEIHWATPYHGQAKPIERAWRDLCDRIAKHPAFAGAYTGNNPLAKPENYGSKAVDWEVFHRVVREEIAAHNAREKRRTRVCDGVHSFDAVYEKSYAQAPIRRATPEQMRQMLLAAEVVTAHRHDGSVRLSGNRYWCDEIAAHAGKKLMIRFDPDALHQSVQVYTLANTYIGEAECVAAVGFADTQAAREHARAKKQYRRGTKLQRDAEIRMSVAEVAAQQVPAEMPTLPEPGVITGMFGKPRYSPDAARATPEPLQRTGTDDARESAFGDLMERLARQQQADAAWRSGGPNE